MSRWVSLILDDEDFDFLGSWEDSRDAAALAFGEDALHAYEQVKRFYTLLGRALEREFAYTVGGRAGAVGEADVITDLGEWEFCASGNTKNSAGNRAQLARVPAGHVVQVFGTPRRGRISCEEFLKLHGIPNPRFRASECRIAAMRESRQLCQFPAEEIAKFSREAHVQ